MAKHEINIYENKTLSKTVAPYLGTYVTKRDVDMKELCERASQLSGLPAIQLEGMILGAINAAAEMQKESIVKVNFDGFCVIAQITGKFATADAEFGPGNKLLLALRLDSDIRNCLINVTPTIVTEETTTKLRVLDVQDVAEPRPYGLVHGKHPFLIFGVNMVLTDEGAAAYLQNALGTTFDLVVDEVVTKQLFKAHCADVIEPGDYKLVVKSKAGDAGGPLQTAFRRVKLMKVESPKPKITVTDMSASKVDEFVSASFGGENLDAVQGYAEGEEGTSFPATFDVAGRHFEGQPVRRNGEQWATMFPCSDVSEGDELTMTLTPDPARTDIDQTPVVVKVTL